ncbi:hypothetical protein A2U01_0036660, partial [Trifolium medium]|nr:hypothetical protein [Trifolium medium]
ANVVRENFCALLFRMIVITSSIVPHGLLYASEPRANIGKED